MMKSAKIGQILFERALITERDLEQALSYQREVGGLIGQALLRLGALTEEALLAALSDQLGIDVLDPTAAPREAGPYREAADLLGISPTWFSAHHAVIWFGEAPGEELLLNVVAQDPLSLALRELLETHCWRFEQRFPEKQITLAYHLALNTQIETLIGLIDPNGETGEDDVFDAMRLREMAEEAPVIDFVNMVFSTALKENASDIHIEPFEHIFHVRFRVDGVLRTFFSEPRGRFDPVASRVKLLSGMDIAERRLPQDGRQTIRFAGQEIDLRVSALPGSWGESLVLRLLKKEQNLPDLIGLGLTGRTHRVFVDLIKNANGIILVTGPTGSGKSTTLYRGLEEVNDGVKKIITIEDPVEYDMENVTQIQVKSDIGYTFARGLRAILRQDPDVIMVGEIRDGETAQIAVQAALTGHLVLSTLHTNSALAALPRLIDMNVEPFLVAAVLRGVIGQRLVRRLCSHCASLDHDGAGEAFLRQAAGDGARLENLETEPARWRKAEGCAQCGGSGYRGRLAIFEIVPTDERMHDAIIGRAAEAELQAIARRSGFLTMFEDGVLKARAGLTTLSEVMRVAGGEAELQAIARRSGFLTMFEDGVLKARAGLTTLSEVMRVAGGEADVAAE